MKWKLNWNIVIGVVGGAVVGATLVGIGIAAATGGLVIATKIMAVAYGSGVAVGAAVGGFGTAYVENEKSKHEAEVARLKAESEKEKDAAKKALDSAENQAKVAIEKAKTYENVLRSTEEVLAQRDHELVKERKKNTEVIEKPPEIAVPAPNPIQNNNGGRIGIVIARMEEDSPPPVPPAANPSIPPQALRGAGMFANVNAQNQEGQFRNGEHVQQEGASLPSNRMS